MLFDSFGSRVEAAVSSWRDVKLFIERSVEVSTESIHVVVGVFILLLSSALLRTPVSTWRPWVVVLAFACVNELIDLSVEHWPQPAMQLGESVNDLIMTMLVPSVLLFTARKTPWLYHSVPKPRSDPSRADGTDCSGI